MTTTRETIHTEVDHVTATRLREIAAHHGTSVEAVVASLLHAYVQSQPADSARPDVIDAYQQSHAQFASLYTRLAK